MDQYNFGKLDQDPDPHESGLGPDAHGSLRDQFGALEGPNLEKVSGRIWIRIRVKFKGRIRIRNTGRRLS
jgi:hypothetical protein